MVLYTCIKETKNAQRHTNLRGCTAVQMQRSEPQFLTADDVRLIFQANRKKITNKQTFFAHPGVKYEPLFQCCAVCAAAHVGISHLKYNKHIINT